MKELVFSTVLFLTAFLPRAIYPVNRSSLWHDRGIVFLDALQSGDLANTIQSPHPGIMTMWLVAAMRGLALTLLPEQYNASFLNQMQLEIIPLALVIALLICLTYFLLRRLFNPLAAMAASLLLALDPFHIAVSKTIHVDALMSMLLLVAALFILVFINQPEPAHKRPLVFSGLFAGLALLTKTPALFIVPYLALCLLIWQIDALRRAPQQAMWPALIAAALRMIRPGLLWLAVLLASFVLLNPALWADPSGTVGLMFSGTANHTQNPHLNPVLFRGTVTVEDPGMMFYVVTTGLKTTAVVTIAFVVGVAALFWRRIAYKQRRTLWLILAFAIFFLIQMSLGSKKSTRYILPTLEAVILLGGVGSTLVLQSLWPQRQKAVAGVLLLAVLAQAFVSLSRHPYYGTHYNRLAGTTETLLASGLVAGQEQGEGLDLAAAYLNSLPNAVLTAAGTQIPESFSPYFAGKTVPLTDDEPDYIVFTRNWTEREMKRSEWGAVWAAYQERTPKFVVEFDGVPYVWVYKSGPTIDKTVVDHWLPVQLGNDMRLLGYSYEPEVVAPGEPVTLTLYWEAAQATSADYTVFTHLVDGAGNLIAQRDSQPQAGLYPTYLWAAGEGVEDSYELIVPAATAAGPLSLALGMYTLDTLERLTIQSEPGLMIEDNRLLLPGPTVSREP